MSCEIDAIIDHDHEWRIEKAISIKCDIEF